MKQYGNQRVVQAGVALILAIPWLNPFAPGPSPAVVPLLVSWWCVAMLFGVAYIAGANGGVAFLSSRVIAVSLCGAALVSSVLAMLQYLGWSSQLAPWVNQAGAGEAFANLRQRNQFASLTNIGSLCLIWLAQVRRSQHRFCSLALLVAAMVLGAGNAVSGSRTGLLQLVGLTFACWLWPVTFRRGVALQLLLAVWLAYWGTAGGLQTLTDISGGIFSRVESSESSCASRLVLWANVVELIRQKPWLGWGWGELDYAHYMTLYPGERFCDLLDNAHNLPLHLAVELGIPVALLVCGFVLWLVLHARPWRDTDPTRQMAWGVLALVLLHSLLEYPLWCGPFQMAVGLCVYLLWVTGAGRDHAPVATFHTRRLLASTAVLTICALAYAAWDYHRVRQIYLAPAQRDPAYRENTLEKIRDTRLFQRQVDFAVLSLTPLTPANALDIYALSTQLLHYSPEPRVIEKVMESAIMLRRDDEALLHLARYRAAFPTNHAQWQQSLVLTNKVSD